MGRGGKRLGAGRKPLPRHLRGIKVGLYIPKHLLVLLDREARKLGVTRSSLASLIVRRYLARLSKKGEKP